MGYRDPNEALRAENEALLQQLKATQEELDALRGGASADDGHHRWAMGMRCLGGVALMLPFLLMTAVCEHRVAPRRAATYATAASLTAPAAQLVEVPRPNITHACQARMAPSPGFESFTRSIERSARVIDAENAPGVAAGTPCAVRVVPVSMQDFNCHVEVVCNGQTVYGGLPTGYAHCDVDGAIVLNARDADTTAQDGDPAINVDLAASRAVVLDTVDGRASRIRLALDLPPALD